MMVTARAEVVVRTDAPTPEAGGGAEISRPASCILRFRAERDSSAGAVQAVQAVVDAYLAGKAGDQARLLIPAHVIPQQR